MHRFSEVLAAELEDERLRLLDQPRPRADGADRHVPDDAPWTPPECAPRLVHALATGEFDPLAGRYLHAEHDPPETRGERIAVIQSERPPTSIRLRR